MPICMMKNADGVEERISSREFDTTMTTGNEVIVKWIDENGEPQERTTYLCDDSVYFDDDDGKEEVYIEVRCGRISDIIPEKGLEICELMMSQLLFEYTNCVMIKIPPSVSFQSGRLRLMIRNREAYDQSLTDKIINNTFGLSGSLMDEIERIEKFFSDIVALPRYIEISTFLTDNHLEVYVDGGEVLKIPLIDLDAISRLVEEADKLIINLKKYRKYMIKEEMINEKNKST